MAEDLSRIKRLEATLQVKQAEAERIANAFPVDDEGRFEIPTDMHADYVKAVGEGKEIKALIDAETAQAEITGYLAADEGKSIAAADAGWGAAEQRTDPAAAQYTDLASVFMESKAYLDAAGAANPFDGPFKIHAGLEGKSIYNFSAQTVTHQTLGQADNLGLAEQAKRSEHIRDLFPKSSTQAAILYGVRETGWTNNAAQRNQMYAADGTSAATGNDSTDVWGTAPKSQIALTPVLYPVAEIKHYIKAHKSILADAPRLRTFLNQRMTDGVKYAEDNALLHSTAGAEKITGIFNTSGVQAYTGLSSDKSSVQVRRAATKAKLAEYQPNGLVVSPTMWESIEVEQDSNGQFRVAISVAIGATKQVWRLNVVETTAMSDTNFLLGNFGLGAELHDREMVSVQVSTEDGTDFIDGAVTFLGTERLALEIPRPESLVIGTWTGYVAP